MVLKILHSPPILMLICGFVAPNPHGGGYVTSDPSSYPHPVNCGAAYIDAYGMPFIQTSVGRAVDETIPYNSGTDAAVIGGIGGTVVSSNGGVATWERPYDPSLAQK